MWARAISESIVGMPTTKATMSAAAVYRIRVQGHVPLDWNSMLFGIHISTSDADGLAFSTLVGRLPDQAALCGLLTALYEQQFPILSVDCLELG
jgi:hypothetical protein